MQSKLFMRKKFFSTGILVFLMLFIIACGSSDDSPPPTYNNSGAVGTPLPGTDSISGTVTDIKDLQLQTVTFDAFIQKWNGRGIDVDDAYGNQCMDLMHQYTNEVLGFDALHALTAYQAYLDGDSRFDKIPNTPTGVPQKGDLVFWNTGVGVSGHVAVFIDGDVNRFSSFDQNWPNSPTGTGLAHIQEHNWNYVAGWLHPRNVQQDADVTALQNDTSPVEWYYFYITVGGRNIWYIVNREQQQQSVMLLKSVDHTFSGGIRWKPINNYPTFAGFSGAGQNFSYISLSADGRRVTFGSLVGYTSDSDITRLANTTLDISWLYFRSAAGVWYIVNFNQEVLLLKAVDESFAGGIRWKPINNYPTFAGFPAAGQNYSWVNISGDSRNVSFGSVQ